MKNLVQMLNQMGSRYNGHKYGCVFPPAKSNNTHIQKERINANDTYILTHPM